MLAERFRFADAQAPGGPGAWTRSTPPRRSSTSRRQARARRELTGLPTFRRSGISGRSAGMQLHWDGNNTQGRGAQPERRFRHRARPRRRWTTRRMARIEDWFSTSRRRRIRMPIERREGRARQGDLRQVLRELPRRSTARTSAARHVGKVTPIAQIGTDRAPARFLHLRTRGQPGAALRRLRPVLRFRNFRKTYGYANMPLDGLWLRAPYLHNGSVPTLRDLLEPVAQRPDDVLSRLRRVRPGQARLRRRTWRAKASRPTSVTTRRCRAIRQRRSRGTRLRHCAAGQ